MRTRSCRYRGVTSDLPTEHTISAGPHTDLFIDPDDGSGKLDAPRLVVPVDDAPYQLSARVRVEFAATYDAGALLVWRDDQTWGKLCFERSPQGSPMVV